MIRGAIRWLLSAPPGPRAALEAICWWEVRRPVYNLVCAAAGVLGLCLLAIFVTLAHGLRPGEDLVEPMALVIAPILANLAYTLGWVVEIAAARLVPKLASGIGPRLLNLGLWIAVAGALLPGILWAGYWVAHSGVRLLYGAGSLGRHGES